MAIQPAVAVPALTDLVREDREEARIWRSRLENLLSSTTLASFAISAFFLGRTSEPSAGQLRVITLFVDCTLVLVTTVFFFRVRHDLVSLRKGQKYRQDLLCLTVVDPPDDFKPFDYPPGTKKAITDSDLTWLFALSVGLILAKMIALVWFPTVFLSLAKAH